MKQSDLVLGIGGAAIGAGLTYWLTKRGGEAGIPADIRRQAARMEAYEVPGGMTPLEIIGVMPFTHVTSMRGGLYVACLNTTGNENNPLAVMKVYTDGTTVWFSLGHIAGNDVFFCTKGAPSYSATLSGKTVYITCPAI